jgi:hypothetical protein
MSNEAARVEFSLEWSPADEKWVASCGALEGLSYSSTSPDEALAGLLTLIKGLRMSTLIFDRNLTSDQVSAFMALGDFDRDCAQTRT